MELTQHCVFCRLVVRASHRAKPWLRGGKPDSILQWETQRICSSGTVPTIKSLFKHHLFREDSSGPAPKSLSICLTLFYVFPYCSCTMYMFVCLVSLSPALDWYVFIVYFLFTIFLPFPRIISDIDRHRLAIFWIIERMKKCHLYKCTVTALEDKKIHQIKFLLSKTHRLKLRAC